MPFHVYTRSGPGAVRVIVETAREALAKAADFLEDGQREVTLQGSAWKRSRPRCGSDYGRN
jgi:hypothetical protein